MNTLTDTQLATLRAIHEICEGRTSKKLTTAEIAWKMDSNNLAVTASLNALVKRGYVRSSLVANASVNGGAYKNGYSLSIIGKRTVEIILDTPT